ncbi:hypothetical protein [Deinococcus humi]|uniref:Uncharacterized protein n=1 Tax=Deinococcus humi TaxID=662880 RepID=A0A7W8JX67_9DEIO|nr:hypothetical protein [Deinococcus humi]MBB5364882.1 hypothetical protein [Deinococcus humi]QLG12163.1 hypothetical protein HLB42_16285 [Deinococcus sp. D7000]GGO33782.1 hypothetical protein GCM10008949_33530 [Deinococcus humi]
MDVPQPVLLLVVPADWEADPKGVTELRRCLGEDHSGRLMLRMATTPLRSPLAHYCGLWGRAELRLARRDLAPRIEAAFSKAVWPDLGAAG